MNLILNKTELNSDEGVRSDPDNHLDQFISILYDKCFRFNSGKNMTNHSIPIKNSTSGGEFDFYRLNIFTIHLSEYRTY